MTQGNNMTNNSGILKGMTVLDCSQILAGPYCSMILADMGARVIKIEKPKGGDDIRTWGPFKNGESVGFMNLNRNKESIVIDFKSPEGIDVMKSLVKKSDVIIENYRTGTMEKLGLGYEDLKKINNKIIYIISWFLLFNSILIILNFLIPEIGSTIRPITKESYELFRFSAFWGSFQLPSYIFIIQSLFFQKLPRFHYLSLLSSLALSRSLLPIVFLVNIFRYLPNFLNKKLLKKIILLILFGIFSSLFIYIIFTDFSLYFEENLVKLFMLQDYSLETTLSEYRNIFQFDGILDNLFGRNYARFTEYGGADSFYTRWFIGSGFLTLLSLELIKLRLAFTLTLNKFRSCFLYLFMIYVDMKGELILTSVALIFILAIYNKKQYLIKNED